MKMKRQQFSIFAILSVLMIFSTFAFGQEETFTDPNADYTFKLLTPNGKNRESVSI
ncbi:MAG: hypothetical protein IPG67_14070 [Acidobacteria bacterium]|nr:hypothetical protein [Acidobacteriota bacterium]